MKPGYPPTYIEAKRRLFSMMLLRSYEKKEVKLSSGRMSDFYIDCKKVTLHTDGMALIGLIGNTMLKNGPAVEAVGGLTMGADPIAMSIALESRLAGPFVFQPFIVRKEPKRHGTEQYIEGNVHENQKVCVIDDVITTGASTIKAIELCAVFGLVVSRVLVLVDRQEDNGRGNVERALLDQVHPRDPDLQPVVEAVFTREQFEQGKLEVDGQA